MAAQSKITADEAEALIKKIIAGEKISTEDATQLRSLTLSLAASVAVLDSQIADLKMTIEILESESDAQKASRAAALNSLRMIAPPAATIDVDEALQETAALRKKISESNSIAEMAIAVGRFAVGVASRFI